MSQQKQSQPTQTTNNPQRDSNAHLKAGERFTVPLAQYKYNLIACQCFINDAIGRWLLVNGHASLTDEELAERGEIITKKIDGISRTTAFYWEGEPAVIFTYN